MRRRTSLAVVTLAVMLGSAATAADSAELRSLLREGQYARIIRMLEPTQNTVDYASREHLELLAIAYQRAGQLSKARDAYRRYLDAFPDAPEAARIRQRLTAMLTARLPDSRQDRSAGTGSTDQDKAPSAWQSRTLWSAFTFVQGNHQEADTRNGGSSADSARQLQLTSNLDSQIDNKGARVPVSLRAQIGFTSDVRGGTVETDPRIRRLWAEAGEVARVRIGRQRIRRLGIFGTLDGAQVSWQPQPRWTLRGAAGAPLAFGELKPDTAHQVVSLGTTYEPTSASSLSVYFNNDRVEGLSNRRAIGGEFRFRSGDLQAYANTDFDVLHHALNLASARVTWQSTARLETYVSFDYRLSPFAATLNALIGQPGDALQDLRDRGVSESLLMDIATRHSIKVRTTTLGATFMPDEDWRLSARLTRGDQSGNRGVPELRNLQDELLLREIPGFDGDGARTEIWGQVVRDNVVPRLSLGAAGRVTQRNSGDDFLATLFGRWRHPNGLDLQPRVRILRSQLDTTERRGVLLELRAGLRSSRGSSVSLDLSYSLDAIRRPFGDVNARRLAAFIGYVLVL